MKRLLQTAVHRRLLPYYLAITLEGFVLWFAIEKVFMRSVGFTDSQITLAIAGYGLIVLLTEIPFGILADRTSRKGMTIFSLLLLATCTLIMGLASAPSVYLVGMAGFALYSSSGSGLDDSIIYDTLMEEEGSRVNYEKYYGREHIYISVSLVASSLLGGLVADRFGMDRTYFFTVPIILLAALSVTAFKEPRLHKVTEKTFIAQHFKETLQHIARPGVLRWIVVAMLSIGVICAFLLEADQLWPLALGVPLVWYGPLNAALLGGYGFAGALSSRITKLNLQTKAILGFGLASMALLAIPNIWGVAFAQVVVLMIFSALLIVANGKLHDEVESRYRAGASSVVSSLTSLCFLPLVIVFGRLTDVHSVFWASLMLPPIALLAVYSYVRVTSRTA